MHRTEMKYVAKEVEAKEDKAHGGIPLLLLLVLVSVVCFAGLCLTVFLLGREYSRETADDLSTKLRHQLPEAVSSSLEKKLDIVPRFMNSTLNFVAGRGLDLQTWGAQVELRDAMVSYLRTFPEDSRCCSGFVLVPPGTRVGTPGPQNNFSIFNVVLLRPGGIDWWTNTTAPGVVRTGSWDWRRREATAGAEIPMAALDIRPWFGGMRNHPLYTPAVVWPLDEVQLKLHATAPLYSGNDWVGTYVAGFKLGFLSKFLNTMLEDGMASWTIFVVDTAEANRGILLATSTPKTPVLSCFVKERCDAGEFEPCRVCGAGESATPVHMTESSNPLVSEMAGSIDLSIEGRVDSERSVAGTEYLVTAWPIRRHGTAWVGVLLVPRSDIFGTLDDGERNSAIAFSALIVGGAVVFALLSLLIASPLKELSEHFAEVGSMNLDRVPQTTMGKVVREFSIIESAFKSMVIELAEYRAFLPKGILAETEDSDDESEIESTPKRAEVTSPSTISHSDARSSASTRGRLGCTQLSVQLNQGKPTVLSVSYRYVENDTLAGQLNRFISAVSDCANEFKGIAEFADGCNMLIVWGGYNRVIQPQSKALHTAVRLSEAVDVTIGISSGPAMCGTVGSITMRKLTVVGPVVTTAIKLNELNTEYGTKILVDYALQQSGQYLFELGPIDVVCIGPKKVMISNVEGHLIGSGTQEWMYELDGSPVHALNAAWRSFLDGDSARAASFLDEVPESYLGVKRLRYLISSVVDGSNYAARIKLSTVASP